MSTTDSTNLKYIVEKIALLLSERDQEYKFNEADYWVVDGDK